MLLYTTVISAVHTWERNSNFWYNVCHHVRKFPFVSIVFFKSQFIVGMYLSKRNGINKTKKEINVVFCWYFLKNDKHPK